MAWGGAINRVGLNECSEGIIEVMLQALGKIWYPPGDYEWEIGTSVSFI